MERYFKRKNLALAALLLLGLLPIALGRVPELPSSGPAGALSPVMDVRLYLRHNHFAIFFSVITLFVGGVILCCGGYLGRTVRTYHRKWRQAGLLLGAFIFRLVYTIALRFDMPAFMLKLVSSVIVVLAISGPYLKSRWPMIRRRLAHRSGAAKGGN